MYCVMRIEKRKKQDVGGLQKEANRTATEYNNRVQTDRTGQNLALIHSNNWAQDIQDEITRAGAKERANSVVALDTIYTASPEFFQGNTVEQNNQFFRDCLQFHQQHFGHIVSAVIHYDETTPHLHVLSVPLTQDCRLSARDVVGNRTHMSQLLPRGWQGLRAGAWCPYGRTGEKATHISPGTQAARNTRTAAGCRKASPGD